MFIKSIAILRLHIYTFLFHTRNFDGEMMVKFSRLPYVLIQNFVCNFWMLWVTIVRHNIQFDEKINTIN